MTCIFYHTAPCVDADIGLDESLQSVSYRCAEVKPQLKLPQNDTI